MEVNKRQTCELSCSSFRESKFNGQIQNSDKISSTHKKGLNRDATMTLINI